MTIHKPQPHPAERRPASHHGAQQQQRGLHHHAQAQGYSGLDSYLQARVQQQVSLTRVVSELGTTTAEEDSWGRPGARRPEPAGLGCQYGQLGPDHHLGLGLP